MDINKHEIDQVDEEIAYAKGMLERARKKHSKALTRARGLWLTAKRKFYEIEFPARGVVQECERRLNELKENKRELTGVSENQAVQVIAPYRAINELKLTTRTKTLLLRSSIECLDSIAAKNKYDLLAIYGFGEKSLEEVERVLEQHGLKLADADDTVG